MAVDWFADPLAWTGFLRAQGFPLGVNDDLRVTLLLEELRNCGISLPDVAAATRWLGPVLCRNADQQERLPMLLDGFAALVEPTLPVTVSPVTVQVEQALKSAKSWWWLVGVALVSAAVVAAAAVLNDTLQPTPTQSQSIVQAGPPMTGAAWLTEILAVLANVGLTLFPLLLATVLLVTWHLRRAALLRGLAPRDARRSGLGIRIVDLPLFRSEALHATFADLRRHRMIPSEGIDVPASVVATVAAAGFVTLVPARLPALPEHLLLVDLAGRDDHMGALADLLMVRFRAENVGIERYDFDGDPRHLSGVGGPIDRRSIFSDLATLRAEHPDHRLLVLSDTATFGDSAGGLRDWVDDLQLWQEAAVITPLPAALWGPRERALIRRGFAVTEATPPGLASLVRQLREKLPIERATPGGAALTALDQRLSVDPYLWLGDTLPPERVVRGLLTDLNAALGRDGFFWLSALAVFPLVHPKLTLALGGVLPDVNGQTLLTEDRLARLCRLPWLRRGRMPDWLRLALVRGLEQRDAEAARARTAWTYLLDPVQKGVEGTLPITVVQRVASGLPELVGRMLRRQPEYREAILLSFMNRKKLPELAVELPAQLTRVLRTGPAWTDLAVLLAGAILSGLAAVYGAAILRALRSLLQLAVIYASAMLRAASDPQSAAVIALALAVASAVLTFRPPWRGMFIGFSRLTPGVLAVATLAVVAWGWHRGPAPTAALGLAVAGAVSLVTLVWRLATLVRGALREQTKAQRPAISTQPQIDPLERATIRRVAWQLLPLLMLGYFCAYLDRVNVGFAALTMNKALGFSAAVFGFGSGVFFIGYFLSEIPSNLVMFKVGARRCIASMLAIFGIISGLTAFIWDASSFYTIRFLLGLAEAGFYPGIILYLTWWFPSYYRSRIIGIFMTAIPISIILGSIVSSQLLLLDGGLGLRGWQWLFILEAIPPIILGVVVMVYLTDGPAQAKWLRPDQQQWLVARLAAERAQRELIRHYGLGETLRNPRIWLLTLVYFGQNVSGYGFVLFLPQIVRKFGASIGQVGLITAIPYVFGAIAMVAWGWHSDRTGERNKHAAAACLLAFAGLAVCVSIDNPVIMMAALVLAQMGQSAIAPTFWSLPTAMLSGIAAAGGIAMINAVGNLGGFLGPFVFGLVKDSTGSDTVGLLALAGAPVVSAIVLLSLGHDRRLERFPISKAAEYGSVSRQSAV